MDEGAAEPAVLAARALELAEAEPARARALAGEALARAGATGDAPARCAAERALGVAARAEDDLDAAVVHLRRSARVAARAGLPGDAGQARVALAGALALGGDFRSAMREVDAAGGLLRGADAAVLEAQRAWLLEKQGRLDDALAAYRRALPAVERSADALREAKIRNNVGLLLDQLGDPAGAAAELQRAEALYADLGHERVAAHVRLNLGWVAVHRGELPAALRWFDQADRYYRDHGRADPMALRDRCEGLLAARLVPEARRAAEQAVAELERRGMAGLLAEARLTLSEAALLAGDTDTAGRAAAEARAALARQRRPGWVALARYAELRAAWFGGDRSSRALAGARRTADALAAAGWATHALDARLMAGRLALDTGRLDVARQELARTGAARTGGPVEVRSRAWHAEALLRLADGDRRGADAALRAGVAMLDRYRSTLGATELRVHASAHAADLVALGLELALADGSPARVLQWVERSRAAALRLRPVSPPADAGVGAKLAELRAVLRELEQATLDGADAGRLLARQARLEEAVRRRMHALPGEEPLAGAGRPPSVQALRAALDGQALVELVASGGALHAVVVTAGKTRLHALGPVDDVREAVDALRFNLRRLLRSAGDGRARLDSVARSAERVDGLLVRPLLDDAGDRPLVVVPTGPLHAVPWAALPSCRGRRVSVSPSAALWLRAAGAPAAGDSRTVLAAGPRLPGAAAEVGELGRAYPAARLLAGVEATVEQVLAALDGAGVAHVAAHARFRADNPLFSSLELADGPLTVCDLERLDRAPRTVVLSACDAGLSSVTSGDELIGLAAALLALGTRSLVATVLPLPDRAAWPLMTRLHALLREGVAPADALARVQADPGTDPVDVVAASAFVFLGAA